MPIFSESYPWPKMGNPSSRVITEVTKDTDPLDLGFLWPHETLRWIMRELVEIMEAWHEEDTWKDAVFFDLWDFIEKVIRGHHEVEEKFFNPALKAAGGSLPERISSDHGELLQLVRRAGALRGRTGEAGALRELKDTIKQLKEQMEDHLAEEEEVYPKVERELGWTKENEDRILKEAARTMPVGDLLAELPIHIYCAHLWRTHEQVDEHLGSVVPPGIPFLMNKVYLPSFFKETLGRIESLKSGQPYEAKRPCCGCTVQ